MFSEDDEEFAPAAKREAVELFRRAYAAQLENDFDAAAELYRRSIETFPTAEAHTFLGWVYSFESRYDEAIDACLEAIRTDPTLGNPYNDIGSYLVAQGDLWTCVRWFRRALAAPRYDARAFPHLNLARVYEQRGRLLDAARHYGLSVEAQPGFAQAAKLLRRVQSRLN
jgi:tetratricopeptide (TPR) repeat protein